MESKKEFLKRIIKERKLIEYIRTVVIPKYKFLIAYKRKKSCLLNFPKNRATGKTTLIYKLACKKDKHIMTNHRFFIRNKKYICMNHKEKCWGFHPAERIFFVDGLEKEVIEELKRRGCILIGYIN